MARLIENKANSVCSAKLKLSCLLAAVLSRHGALLTTTAQHDPVLVGLLGLKGFGTVEMMGCMQAEAGEMMALERFLPW